MSTTCRSCSAAIDLAARFCSTCGQRQADEGQVTSDERRVATVVIGDIAGYTTLSEQIDPEQLKAVMDACFTALAEDVIRYGGTVDKIVGDAIVALFGAPVAHEDDPERAVRAALAMQATIAGIDSRTDHPLRMRIGVNTGEVVVGRIAGSDTYTATGDAVNVASRLETAAEPGQVLVSAETAEALDGAIELEEAGELHARGRRAPVRTFRALRVTAPPGRRNSSADRGRLVGRDPEIALFDTLLHRAWTRRRAHLLEIVGDPGVGKRRLADAFGDLARREHGALVLSAHAQPYGEGSIWAPAVALLASVTPDGALQDPDRRPERIAALTGWSQDDPRTRQADEVLGAFSEEGSRGVRGRRLIEHRQDEIAAVAAGLLEPLAAERPIVAILTGVHDVDTAVIDLLTTTTLLLRRAPVVAVCTSRGMTHHDLLDPGAREQDDPVLATASRLWHSVDTTIMRLTPLSDAEAAALIRARLGHEVDDNAVAAMVRRSGGNPLMLEQLATHLEAGATTADTMPSTLRGLVAARLDSLSPLQRRIVADAAVLGYSGPRDLLESLCGDLDPAEVRASLETLQDADILRLDERDYRFKTDALREGAYLRLPKATRVARHVTIAEHFAGRIADGEQVAIRRRAQHLDAAAALQAGIGEVDPALVARTVAALDEAGRWAMGRDPAVAAEMWGRALVLRPRATQGEVDDLPTADAIELQHARALAATGRHDVAARTARRLRDDAATAEVRAGAAVLQGEIHQARGELSRSEEALRAAAATARDAGLHDLAATALRALGLTLIFAGSNGEARAVLTQAAQLIDDDDLGAHAWIDQHLGWIAFNEQDLGTAVELAERAESAFRQVGDPRGIGFSQGLLGWVAFVGGDLSTAAAHGRAALRAGTRAAHDAFGRGVTEVLMAAIALWRGGSTEAEERSSAGASISRGGGHRWGEMLATSVRARALAMLGRPSEAAQQLDDCWAIARDLGDPVSAPMVASAAADVSLAAGEAEAALATIDAVERVQTTPDLTRLRALALLQLGQVEAADDAATAARTVALGDGQHAAATAIAALAAAAAGSAGEAEQLSRAVLDNAMATYLDRTWAHVARSLAAARAGDEDRARTALDDARTALGEAEHLPAHAVLDLLAARLGLLDEEVAEARMRPAGLTGDGWLRLIRSR